MTQRKRIYIAYTGGTIGMMRSEHGYVPAPGFLEKSLRGMPEFYRPEMPGFCIVRLTILLIGLF